MADKIQSSYKSTKNIYDVIITHKTWWSKLYRNIVWKGGDNNVIAKKLLGNIPNEFSGKILDVPVGTGVFVCEKYNNLKNAEITCLDYSEDMLNIARERMRGEHINLIRGDVGDLQFPNENFDVVLSMNGFHVFPDKDKAFAEVTRVLKKDGILLASFYVDGKGNIADFVVKKHLPKKGSLPFRLIATNLLGKDYQKILNLNFLVATAHSYIFVQRKNLNNYRMVFIWN